MLDTSIVSIHTNNSSCMNSITISKSLLHYIKLLYMCTVWMQELFPYFISEVRSINRLQQNFVSDIIIPAGNKKHCLYWLVSTHIPHFSLKLTWPRIYIYIWSQRHCHEYPQRKKSFLQCAHHTSSMHKVHRLSIVWSTLHVSSV